MSAGEDISAGAENLEAEIMNNIEIGSFEERKAMEYVENVGMDMAIEKLTTQATKNNSHAKNMLDIILGWHSKIEAYKHKENNNKRVTDKPSFSPAQTSISREKLNPKQRMEKIVDHAGIGFDVSVDENWHPVVPVQWNSGRAEINNKPVIFPREDKPFMKRHILRRDNAILHMHLLNADKNRIIAKPDKQKFYSRMNRLKREKQKKKQEETEYICGTVTIGHRGLFIKSSAVNKRIDLPRRFMEELLLKRGAWKFKVVRNDEKRIVVVPEKYLEEDNNNNHQENRNLRELYSNGKVNL